MKPTAKWTVGKWKERTTSSEVKSNCARDRRFLYRLHCQHMKNAKVHSRLSLMPDAMRMKQQKKLDQAHYVCRFYFVTNYYYFIRCDWRVTMMFTSCNTNVNVDIIFNVVWPPPKRRPGPREHLGWQDRVGWPLNSKRARMNDSQFVYYLHTLYNLLTIVQYMGCKTSKDDS